MELRIPDRKHEMLKSKFGRREEKNGGWVDPTHKMLMRDEK